MLSDGQVIVSPTNATFNSTKYAVCDGSGNIITDRVIIKNPSGITTGIDEAMPQVSCDKLQVTGNDWFTIDGQKLSGMPTKKGIYIHNGNKLIVK